MTTKQSRAPRVHMFVGLPGTGKSTFRAKLEGELADEGVSFVVLSTDDFIEKCARDTGRSYNDMFFANIKLAGNVLRAGLRNAIKERQDVIWDQTNLVKTARKKKLNNFPKGYLWNSYFFQADWKDVVKVNEARKSFGRSIPMHVLERMRVMVEEPSQDEGFFELTTNFFMGENWPK